jgi:DNA primase
MNDLETLKQTIDLLALVGGGLRKVASTRGGEFAGPCPKCGGEDRFHVQPEVGLWMCRSCHPAWGDQIEYVRWRDDCGFREAVETLGGDLSALGGRRGTIVPNPAAATAKALPPAPTPPGAVWQGRARDFVATAQRQLWQDPKALAYLHGRGLNDDTIRQAGLGYNPKELWDKRETWGLAEGKGIWLPVGWVIPAVVADVVWYVKIRRPGDVDPKYAQPRGGHPCLFGADSLAHHPDAILTEGEFDCLLLRQEVGAICGVASLGSASAMPDDLDAMTLIRVRRIWLAYDLDADGQKGAAAVAATSRRIRQLLVPLDPGKGKDVTDAWKDGVDLVTWVASRIGPAGGEDRRQWLEHSMDKVEAAGFGVTDGQDPRVRACRALQAELERL